MILQPQNSIHLNTRIMKRNKSSTYLSAHYEEHLNAPAVITVTPPVDRWISKDMDGFELHTHTASRHITYTVLHICASYCTLRGRLASYLASG